LRAIQAGTYTITEVYAADREGRLDALTGERAIVNRPLWSDGRELRGPSALERARQEGRRRFA
jgi:hypothetical protein